MPEGMDQPTLEEGGTGHPAARGEGRPGVHPYSAGLWQGTRNHEEIAGVGKGVATQHSPKKRHIHKTRKEAPAETPLAGDPGMEFRLCKVEAEHEELLYGCPEWMPNK